MSIPTATFRCPTCAATVSVTIRRSVIPQDDPAGRERILAGLGWVYRCDGCGACVLVDHDVLYYDRDLRFMIYYPKDFETPAVLPPVNRHASTPATAYTLRLVFHHEDLRDKVR